MLGYYAMSITGSSHTGVNKPCEDASEVRRLSQGWIAAAVADGLGSVKHGKVGAETAVATALRFVEEHLPLKWHDESLIAALRLAYIAADKAIWKIADEHSEKVQEYDTTLTMAIYNGVNVVYGHVGDGGIITLSRYGEFAQLTTAQKGEAFNETAPLRHGPEYWEFGKTRDSTCALLLMTDGIYDKVCLPILAKTDTPILIDRVRPFMDTNVLLAKTEKDFKEAEVQFHAFFSKEKAWDITDDKTIVGIINTDEKPRHKEYPKPNWEALKKIQEEGLNTHTTPSKGPQADAPPPPREQQPARSPTSPSPPPGDAGKATGKVAGKAMGTQERKTSPAGKKDPAPKHGGLFGRLLKPKEEPRETWEPLKRR